jgi:glycosyltransferase involved in cell wall biosynthesis
VVRLEEALKAKNEYYCIITHNITDLLDVKTRNEPKIIMLHTTLEGRVEEEKGKRTPAELRDMLHQYLDAIGGHAVATSITKGKSWGWTEDIVTFGMDADDYYPHTGEEAEGLRICNFIESRRKILMWELHEKAFGGLAVKLVGHNPGMAGVKAAKNWEDLKRQLQRRRFYIHTAEPKYEEGFNMSTIEAMTAGMPVIGNKHPTSPIRHGVSGFLSDDPDELRRYAIMLLGDRNLANSMGEEARKTAIEQFSITRFREAFWRSIETARGKGQRSALRPCSRQADSV